MGSHGDLLSPLVDGRRPGNRTRAVYSSPLPLFIKQSRTPVLPPTLWETGLRSRLRSRGLLLPKQALYQAELCADGALYGCRTRLIAVTRRRPHRMPHSALNWCVWLDSNEHCTASRTAPSAIGVQTRMMEDQAGFEPAMGASHRIKSPTRSATTVTGPDLEDAVGLEPTMRAEAQRG